MPAATKSDDEYHGEVFTRRWVVEFMLDQARYTVDRDLSTLRLVEPAAGSGAFVLPALERLSTSLKGFGKSLDDVGDSFRAFELQEKNTDTLRLEMTKLLAAHGWRARDIERFVVDSVTTADYLLTGHFPHSVDVLIGNPPYIRHDDLGPLKLAAYRKASSAMVGRADVYIAFFDIGLETLDDDGVCVFICADRWMRNDYGKALRSKTQTGYAFDLVLTMHEADAFEEEVSAYPAITVIRRGRQGTAVIADGGADFHEAQAAQLSEWMADPAVPLKATGVNADTVESWFKTAQSWPVGSPAFLAWLEQMEESLCLVEQTGIKFGIGVATGADEVYVVKGDRIPDIEPERLLPLIVADDIRQGGVFRPTGTMLVNPWDEDGLVNLADWPKFTAYLKKHPGLRSRHTAKANPTKWHKTIDRVNYDLLDRPKLLFQDMKAETTPVLHAGGMYPHHNLYFAVATEDRWDLEVLGGLMLSKVFEAQVAAYCVKMRGGTLRFQTQYLRRVRVPKPEDIPAPVQGALRIAFMERDREAASRAALDAYGLDEIPR